MKLGRPNSSVGQIVEKLRARWILLSIAGFLVVVVVTVVFSLSGSEEQPKQDVVVVKEVPEKEKTTFGCSTDADCHLGGMCMGGGCIVLVQSEYRNVWRDDIRSQLTDGAKWKPASAFGEKLLLPVNCPPKHGNVRPPKDSKLEYQVKVNVFEINPAYTSEYKLLKVKGQIWVDTLRFWFPGLNDADPALVCASSEIGRISLGKGSKMGMRSVYVDAFLHQAVPAGSTATGAVSIKHYLKEADNEGLYTLRVPLPPVFGGGARENTVIAVPLGSDVASIVGPAPKDQRLLYGFVAFYWEHSSTLSEVVMRYRPTPDTMAPFDLTQINP